MRIQNFAKARHKAARTLLAAVCAGLALSACTDGESPSSPSGRDRFSLGLRPQFNMFGGQSQNSEPINFVRMVARDSASGVILGTFEGELVENAPSWELGVDVTIPDGAVPRVIVTIELINRAGGIETVQWSGVTDPIEVQPGSETSPTTPIEIFQGPPSNLGVTSVAIAESGATLVEGDSVRLHATTVTTLPLEPRVFWSSLDPAVAVVGDEGTVHPLRDGTARIVAVAGPRADTVTITALQRPAGVLFTADTLRATSLGQEVTFVARVIDPRGTTIAGASLVWRSLNDSTAVSLGLGRFRTVRSGTVGVLAIVATDTIMRGRGGIVTAQIPSAITLDTTQRAFSALGDTATAIATVRDSRGAAIPGASVVWSTSNAAVCGVGATGRISAVSNGQCDVTATSGALSAAVHVTVQQQPATLEVTETSLLFATLTRTAQLAAIARDVRGNVVNVTPQWTTTDAGIATVNGTGLVTAVANGNAQVSARLGTLIATSAVTIRQVVANLALSPSTLSLLPSDTARVAFAATDSAGAVVPGPITVVWTSSAPGTATVSTAGTVRAIAAGSAQVTARVGEVTAGTTVTVRAPNLRALTITAGVTDAVEGDVVTVRVRVQNTGSANASAASLTLLTLNATTNATLASVTVPQPPVAAGADTTVTVNVTIPRGAGWPDSIDFDATTDAGAVIAESIETDNHIRGARVRIAFLTQTVTLQPDSAELTALGAQTTLVATLRNGAGGVVTRPIAWTSLEPSVATVTGTGVVSAVTPGSARIVATSDGRADTAVVNVRPRVSDVTVSGARTLNFKGATLNLTAAAVDANGNAVAGTRTWRSITPTIVSVDTTGRVTGLAVGTGLIEVTVGGIADTASVPVQQVRASLSLLPATRTMSVGDTVRIVPTVRDSGSAVIPGAAPTWESSAPAVASVNGTGLVQALSPGASTITATLGSLSATAAITVAAPDLGVISFTVTPLTSTAGTPLFGTLTVGNSGSSNAASAPVTLRVLDAATGAVLREQTVDGLAVAAGQTIVEPITSILPTTVAWPDSVRFQIQVNSDHSVADPNVANDTLSSAVVRVRFPVATMALSLRDSSFTSLGDTAAVMTVLRDVHGRLINGHVTTFLSRNGEVASVSAAGVVTAMGSGPAWIVVTSETQTDSVLVHVTPTPASIAVTPSSMSFHAIGSTTAASAVVMDARGNVMLGQVVTWNSADTLVARVDEAGNITSHGAGSTLVTASVGVHTASTTVTVAPVAMTIAINEHNPAPHVGDTLTLSTIAADSNGVALVSPTVVWTSSRPLVATVSNAGVVIALLPDTVTITASVGTVTASTQLSVSSNAPALILADAPALLQGVVGRKLNDTIGVIVKDARGNPVPNVAVEWRLLDLGIEGGSGPYVMSWMAELPRFAVDTTFTDASGRARNTWTLGTRSGQQRMRARALALPDSIIFEARARADAPTRGSKRSGGLEASVSLTLEDVVEIQLFDQFNNPVPDQAIVWSVVGGPGTRSKLPNGASVDTTVTDENGTASIDWSGFDTRVGLHQLRATVNGTAISIDVEKKTKAANAHHGSKLSGGLEAVVSTTLKDTVQIQLFDQFENPVIGTEVDWSLTGDSELPGGGHTYRTTTDSAGRTQIAWTNFDTRASVHRLRAFVDGTPVEITIDKKTKADRPHHANKRSGGFEAVVSTTLTDTVEIEVLDQFGNAVAGEQVDWSLTGNSKLPNDSSTYRTVTDTLGRTRIGWKNFSTTVSLHRLRATIAGTPVDLEIEKKTKAGNPHHASKNSGGLDAVVTTTLTDSVEIQVFDQFENAVAGAHVDWSLTGNSLLPNGEHTAQTTTDTLGITRIGWKSFSTTVSLHRLRASIEGTPVDLTIDKKTKAAGPNHANKRSGGLEAVVSLALTDTVEIEIVDEFGNAVANAPVDWALTGGSSKLPNDSSTYRTVTDTLGRTRIGWKNFSTTVSLHQLRVTVAGSPVDLRIDKKTKAARAHNASKLRGGDSAVVSLALTDTVEIQVFDEFGNFAAGEPVKWSLNGNSKLPNNDTTYETTTDSLGRTRIGWKDFSTTVSLHQLRASIAGTPVDLNFPKQTKHAALKHLHLSPDSISLTAIDSTFEFTSSPTDEFGNAISGARDSLTWTSEVDTIAALDNPKGGKGQAKKNGKTRIRVTGHYFGVTVEDSVAVIVAQQLTGEGSPITGDPTSVIDSTFVLSASGQDAKGNAIRWEWTIVGGIDGSGNAAFNGPSKGPSVTLHGTSLGPVLIRAKDPKGTATREFTVIIVPAPLPGD